MKVAVITPYLRESRAQLERCAASVAAQTYPAQHFLVADGEPQDWIDAHDGGTLRHVRLDRAHGDFGNTPRAVAGILAASEGFDAVCFLDADNWFDPDHVQTCLEIGLNAAQPVDYVVARRRLTRDDGSVLPLVTGDDASLEHVDTNCFFLFWGAFHTLGRWGVMPKPLSPVGDRVYLAALRAAGLRFAVTDHPTVNYLCTWSSVFEAAGESPPEYAKPNVNLTPTVNWWNRLTPRDRDVVNRLAGVEITFG